MSQGLFTVNPNRLETMCTVEYHNKTEKWTVEFDYRKIKAGWVHIKATHLDCIFRSGTRTKRKYPAHIFRELLKLSIHREKFVEYLIDYHIVTNKTLSEKYPTTWVSRMYPNEIYEIIRRALIFDLGTKKVCIQAILNQRV
jgi:hypothetical protein